MNNYFSLAIFVGDVCHLTHKISHTTCVFVYTILRTRAKTRCSSKGRSWGSIERPITPYRYILRYNI